MKFEFSRWLCTGSIHHNTIHMTIYNINQYTIQHHTTWTCTWFINSQNILQTQAHTKYFSNIYQTLWVYICMSKFKKWMQLIKSRDHLPKLSKCTCVCSKFTQNYKLVLSDNLKSINHYAISLWVYKKTLAKYLCRLFPNFHSMKINSTANCESSLVE